MSQYALFTQLNYCTQKKTELRIVLRAVGQWVDLEVGLVFISRFEIELGKEFGLFSRYLYKVWNKNV